MIISPLENIALLYKVHIFRLNKQDSAKHLAPRPYRFELKTPTFWQYVNGKLLRIFAVFLRESDSELPRFTPSAAGTLHNVPPVTNRASLLILCTILSILM